MQTQPQTRIRSRPVFPRRPAGGPASTPRLLLGSVAAAAVLLAALALLGYWQAGAGAVAAARPVAVPAATSIPSPVPAASEVLGAPMPVPDEPVATF
ncbi:hypothetical protein [Variovorax sp. JS1663]|uniref:hypothetical protein n=1 Tax=Variovorax sp. JS1663 TaxID=1851577 RepID=UPI000B347FC4|nr:hypothetical protein [Variovorax sp. JS1663]OUM02643.1 hypothetical protein A8M77_10285 [Variovorax sp. JS1663]